MVRRIRLQPSIQATSSLRSMYSGTVLDQSMYSRCPCGLDFFFKTSIPTCRPVILEKFLRSQHCEGFLQLLYSNHHHCYVCSGQMCCWLLWIKSQLRFPETKGRGQQWIIQDLLCSSPHPPSWSCPGSGQVKTCSNMQEQDSEENPKHESVYPSFNIEQMLVQSKNMQKKRKTRRLSIAHNEIRC